MEIHHFEWVNPLFLWPFSIAKLNYQRVIAILIVISVDGCEILHQLIDDLSHDFVWVSIIQGGAGFLPSTVQYRIIVKIVRM